MKRQKQKSFESNAWSAFGKQHLRGKGVSLYTEFGGNQNRIEEQNNLFFRRHVENFFPLKRLLCHISQE